MAGGLSSSLAVDKTPNFHTTLHKLLQCSQVLANFRAGDPREKEATRPFYDLVSEVTVTSTLFCMLKESH